MRVIRLSKGYVAKIDSSDYKRCMRGNKWYAKEFPKKDGTLKIYAERNAYNLSGKRVTERMHRFLLKASGRKVEVDHKDGDGLNNQRGNLRRCTKFLNQQNRGKNSNNTSGFKDVFHARGKWVAKVIRNSKVFWIGTFACPKEAHTAVQNFVNTRGEK